jgi:hypothetical protein
MGCYGEPYRLEFSSSDATTAAETKLYDSEGNERVLQDWEYIRLVSVNVQMDNAVDEVDLFDDVNDNDSVNDGERLVKVGTNTSGNRSANHDIQFDGYGKYLSTGRNPKVLAASSGTVTVTGVAYVHVAGDYGKRPPWKQQFGQ